MKSFLTLLVLTLLTICTGIVLDTQGVVVGGVSGLCVSLSLILAFFILVISAIARRTFHGVSFALAMVIISAMLMILALTEVSLAVIWPMIPTSVFTAIGFAGVVTYRDGFTSIIGVGGFTVSIGLLVGATWTYLAGALLVLSVALIAFIVKTFKREKKYEIPRISILERAKKIKKEDED